MKRPPRPAFTRLGDVKGAEILAHLKAQMEPVIASPAPPPKPSSSSASSRPAAKANRRKGGAAEKRQHPQKPRKTILKLSRAAIEAAYQAAEPQTLSATSAPTAPAYDFGKAAFDRLRKLQVSLTGFTADHRAPANVSDESRALVIERISLAARLINTAVDPLADGYIGYDFGTSTTKTVVRWPLDSSRDDYAVPVPADCASGAVPHLWPTAVYFDRANGMFSLLPAPGMVQLQGFKGALIEGPRSALRMCAGSGVTMTVAATAFLTLHLAYVTGTILKRDPSARVSGVNLAVPVASLNDRADCPHFDNVVRAAILLISKASTLTLTDVKGALASAATGCLPHDLHAELSGAIAGYCYCRGPRHYVGSHMIIDCGSATLDIASFNMRDDDYPLEIYSAGVELLGADACQAYVAAGGAREDCRKAASYHEHQVFVRAAKAARMGFAQDVDRKYPYQIILVGGGIDTPIYRELFESREGTFARPFHRPQLDPRLRCDDGTHPSRLILADGLARDPIDLRKVAMPNPPKDGPPALNPNYHDWTSN